MVMQLEKVVPFGRSLDEYVHMFNLVAVDGQKRILGVGDGPASFNAAATKLGWQVTSIDPVYEFSAAEILDRFNQVVDHIIQQVKNSPGDWVWSYHQSVDDLRQNRVKAIQTFIADYAIGKQQTRYRRDALPHLQFPDQSFDLALCSHFLLLYSEHHDLQFHLDSIQEMLRISAEVRIFPLLTLMLQRSPYLDAIIQIFGDRGYHVSIEPVAYEFQKGGNEMLRIQRSPLIN
jgi:SAM-dependent methyltransferase